MPEKISQKVKALPPRPVGNAAATADAVSLRRQRWIVDGATPAVAAWRRTERWRFRSAAAHASRRLRPDAAVAARAVKVRAQLRHRYLWTPPDRPHLNGSAVVQWGQGGCVGMAVFYLGGGRSARADFNMMRAQWIAARWVLILMRL